VRRALVVVVVLSAIGALPACKGGGSGGRDAAAGVGGNGGGGADGGGADGGGVIPIATTATQIAGVICPKAYLCCTPDQFSINDLAGTTEPECETKTADFFRSLLQTVQDSQDLGRCRYDQSKVDACLDTIRTSTCAMLNVTSHLSGVPNCASFTTPLVAAGGTCTQAFECIDGLCQKASGATEGTCGPGVAAGQSCTVNECAPGLICDPRDSNSDSDDLCAQPLDDGATCTTPIQCRSANCPALTSGGTSTCMPTTQCFYSAACTAAGGPPSPASLVLAGALVIFAARRSRRRRR